MWKYHVFASRAVQAEIDTREFVSGMRQCFNQTLGGKRKNQDSMMSEIFLVGRSIASQLEATK
jgi:hypothetical protein